jgi:hypothetical protein
MAQRNERDELARVIPVVGAVQVVVVVLLRVPGRARRFFTRQPRSRSSIAEFVDERHTVV